MDAAPTMYKPILPYQTRIIQLFGDTGFRHSPIVCELYVADILHPNFEGLGLRSSDNKQDCLVDYDAVSYTWGAQENSKKIICNGVPFNVTENLFEALKAFRRPQYMSRYIWVDAICINQNDSEEKAIQVRNMLSIYQKATTVVAWLGHAHKNTQDMLDTIANPGASMDIIAVCEGMVNLYTRPWFRRIWVQQEIYAARDLTLQCGNHVFRWSEFLSKPGQLMDHPSLKPYHHLRRDTGLNQENSSTTIPKIALGQFKAIIQAKQLHTLHLGCFEKFSQPNCPQPDLVETLLLTGILNVTNLKDSIYGILGMTGFPSMPMSIRDWTFSKRSSRVFIPIDYSTDLVAILSTVTWAILVKGGLSLLVHLKLRSTEDDRSIEGRELPTWVIDWRLAARLLRRIPASDTTLDIGLKNAWDLGVSRWTDPQKYSGASTSCKIPQHEDFCKDNQNSFEPCTSLLLNGSIDPRYFIKGRCVWEKRALRMDKKLWTLAFDLFSTDLLVYFPAFVRERYLKAGFQQPPRRGIVTPGLWLLRPAQNDEYKLMACLTSSILVDGLPYDHLELDPSLGESVKQSRQFVFNTPYVDFEYEPPLQDGKPISLQKFIIT